MRYRHLSRTQAILEYPLATGVSLWSGVVGVLALYGVAPSRTINQLQHWQATCWAVGILLASMFTLWGLLVSRQALTVARGMYLHMITITVYGISVVAASGFSQGGVVASFLCIIAVVIGREGIVLRRRATPGARSEQ
jgi:hypothetical protein